MLMVTLGTGIGVALLVAGSPFRGPGRAHPEAGHIVTGGSAGRCYCGAEGCWEQAASRTALQTLLREVLPGGTAEKDLLIAAAARRDDPEVRAAFSRYGRLLGQGLATLHTVLMPEVTVLGGSAGALLGLFNEGLADSLARAPGFAVSTIVRPASMGDDGGAVGAALLAAELSPAS
jgi:glucokinase